MTTSARVHSPIYLGYTMADCSVRSFGGIGNADRRSVSLVVSRVPCHDVSLLLREKRAVTV